MRDLSSARGLAQTFLFRSAPLEGEPAGRNLILDKSQEIWYKGWKHVGIPLVLVVSNWRRGRSQRLRRRSAPAPRPVGRDTKLEVGSGRDREKCDKLR